MTPDFTIKDIGFYTGENAQEALKYLLQEITYKPDVESFKNKEGISDKDLSYYLEHGFPPKARFQLQDGDNAINELGLCCGYFSENNKWIAFDNTTNNCFVEEFSTEEECINYLIGY